MWSKAVHEAGEEEERPVNRDCKKQVGTALPLLSLLELRCSCSSKYSLQEVQEIDTLQHTTSTNGTNRNASHMAHPGKHCLQRKHVSRVPETPQSADVAMVGHGRPMQFRFAVPPTFTCIRRWLAFLSLKSRGKYADVMKHAFAVGLP